MIRSAFIQVFLLTLLFNFKSNDLKCQSNQPYVDSINAYKLFVDSLVNSFNSNTESTLLHGIIHYSCLNGNGGYGSGGSADIYQDPKDKLVYQLSYSKGCNNISTERTLYYINNKIVLAIIFDKGKNRINYYRDDKYLNVDGLKLGKVKIANQDLIDGYNVLKEFK